ncbi:MAG: hypothetical protein AVDCRST_MAG19-2863, partial [uncultured Thermomicrobiales bacterium]
ERSEGDQAERGRSGRGPSPRRPVLRGSVSGSPGGRAGLHGQSL